MDAPTPEGSARPSVFVVSLPRSLSTLVYHLARLSLGLAAPDTVTDGEILNPDRLLCPWEPDEHGSGPEHEQKFLRPERDPGRFRRLEGSLDRLVAPRGAIYKDVVQPFAVSRWLGRRDIPVLKIHRPLADVAHAMAHRGWLYPAAAADGVPGGPLPREAVDGVVGDAFLEGLVRAEAALEALPGERVDYDRIVHDDSQLQEALDRLAGDRPVERHRYLDDDFRRRRDETLARRETEAYRQLARRIDAVRRHLAAVPLASTSAGPFVEATSSQQPTNRRAEP